MDDSVIKCKKVTLESTASIIENFEKLDGWIFRGQRDNTFGFESSLERYCNSKDYIKIACKMENLLRHEFESRAHHYIAKDSLPSSKLGWLSLMQHYGAPTRLLDFTYSPYIALFFAQDGFEKTVKNDMSIWAINKRYLDETCYAALTSTGAVNCNPQTFLLEKEVIFENAINSSNHEVVFATEPRINNLRLENQMGLFLLSGSYNKKLDSYFTLVDSEKEESVDAIQFIIKRDLHFPIVKMLSRMGVNNRRIYPGLEGAAKDIALQIKMDFLSLQQATKN